MSQKPRSWFRLDLKTALVFGLTAGIVIGVILYNSLRSPFGEIDKDNLYTYEDPQVERLVDDAVARPNPQKVFATLRGGTEGQPALAPPRLCFAPAPRGR